MKKLVTLLAMATLTTASMAQSRFVTEGQNDFLFREGVPGYSNNRGLVATSWFKYQNKFNPNTYLLLLVQVHCDTQLQRVIREISYVNGEVVSQTEENWNGRWENPIPSTVGARHAVICPSRPPAM